MKVKSTVRRSSPLVASNKEKGRNPLKSVRLTTLVTPDIAEPQQIAGTDRSFWVEVMTSATARALFQFHAVGTDINYAPQMLKTEVKIPQVEELLGKDAPPQIRYFNDYVQHDFDARTGVFAEVVKNTLDEYKPADTSLRGTLSVQPMGFEWSVPTKTPALETAYSHINAGTHHMFMTAPHAMDRQRKGKGSGGKVKSVLFLSPFPLPLSPSFP